MTNLKSEWEEIFRYEIFITYKARGNISRNYCWQTKSTDTKRHLVAILTTVIVNLVYRSFCFFLGGGKNVILLLSKKNLKKERIIPWKIIFPPVRFNVCVCVYVLYHHTEKRWNPSAASRLVKQAVNGEWPFCMWQFCEFRASRSNPRGFLWQKKYVHQITSVLYKFHIFQWNNVTFIMSWKISETLKLFVAGIV